MGTAVIAKQNLEQYAKQMFNCYRFNKVYKVDKIDSENSTIFRTLKFVLKFRSVTY